MKNTNYKILALIDLNDTVNGVVKSAINLGQFFGADIELFYVKKALDVVNKESQLSAMRTINSESVAVDKKIKKLVEPFKDAYKGNIKTTFTFGNVKNQIADYIEKVNPDILVIGKRKTSPLKIIGDKVTDYILNNYQGTVLIANKKRGLSVNDNLALGAFNISHDGLETGITEKLVKQSKVRLKEFALVDTATSNNEETIKSDRSTEKYFFEKNDNAINSLSNYLTNSKVNLLMVDRNGKEKSSGHFKSQLKELINKSEVSMLLPSLRDFDLN